MAQSETEAGDGGQFRARAWTIAARYRDPSDYDIPDVPAWVVGIDRDDRVVFADPETGEPFVRAENPVPVRR